jgi:hypothetical protein
MHGVRAPFPENAALLARARIAAEHGARHAEGRLRGNPGLRWLGKKSRYLTV